jgi:hypothetical protein
MRWWDDEKGSYPQHRIHSTWSEIPLNCVICISLIFSLHNAQIRFEQFGLNEQFSWTSVNLLSNYTLDHFHFRYLWCSFLWFDLIWLKEYYSPLTETQFSSFLAYPCLSHSLFRCIEILFCKSTTMSHDIVGNCWLTFKSNLMFDPIDASPHFIALLWSYEIFKLAFVSANATERWDQVLNLRLLDQINSLSLLASEELKRINRLCVIDVRHLTVSLSKISSHLSDWTAFPLFVWMESSSLWPDFSRCSSSIRIQRSAPNRTDQIISKLTNSILRYSSMLHRTLSSMAGLKWVMPRLPHNKLSWISQWNNLSRSTLGKPCLRCFSLRNSGDPDSAQCALTYGRRMSAASRGGWMDLRLFHCGFPGSYQVIPMVHPLCQDVRAQFDLLAKSGALTTFGITIPLWYLELFPCSSLSEHMCICVTSLRLQRPATCPSEKDNGQFDVKIDGFSHPETVDLAATRQ